MVLAVVVLHPMYPICQKVLPCQLDTTREVINFLIFTHTLKETILERWCGPHYNPIITDWLGLVRQKLVLIDLLILTETVVFKSILYKLNLYTWVKLIKEAFINRLLWSFLNSNTLTVIRSEDKELYSGIDGIGHSTKASDIPIFLQAIISIEAAWDRMWIWLGLLILEQAVIGVFNTLLFEAWYVPKLFLGCWVRWKDWRCWHGHFLLTILLKLLLLLLHLVWIVHRSGWIYWAFVSSVFFRVVILLAHRLILSLNILARTSALKLLILILKVATIMHKHTLRWSWSLTN